MHRGRSILAVVALLLAPLLLGACGGGSDDASDGGAASSDAADGGNDAAADEGEDSGDDGDDGGGELPDPCELVPIETAEEILGEPAAEPESTSSDIGTASRSCNWSTQASVDEPSLDNVGHILTLTVISSPTDAMSIEEFFDSAAEAADEQGDVCEKSYWLGGSLSAFESGVYLTGSAGLADDSADAKAATEALVVAACESL